MPTNRPANHKSPRDSRGGRLEAAIILAVLVICAAIVSGVAWSHPEMTSASLAYKQTGRLAYNAPTSPGSVYGSAGLTTGRPIYGSVVATVTVSYSYVFRAASPATLAGTEQLVATINNGQGITTAIPIQPVATRFTGGKFAVSGTLSLTALRSAAFAFDQAEGTQASDGSYGVVISPNVIAHGRVGNKPLNTVFNSPVSFTYSAGNLVPGTTSASSGTQTQADFTPSSTGAVNLPSGKQAILLLGISDFGARVGSLAVVLAALLLLGLVGWPIVREARSADEGSRISARYGPAVVEAEAVEAHAGVVVVPLSSFEGLFQVARRLECPILHWGEPADVYAVVDSGTLYRYRTGHPLRKERTSGVKQDAPSPRRANVTDWTARQSNFDDKALESRESQENDRGRNR